MSRTCPACRRRDVSVNKPTCLMCWRRVPTHIQKAMHVARRRYLEDSEDVLRIQALDIVIREVITAAKLGDSRVPR